MQIHVCDFLFRGVCHSTSSCISHNSRSYMSNPSLNGQLNALYEYTKHLYQLLIKIAENANKRAGQYF